MKDAHGIALTSLLWMFAILTPATAAAAPDRVQTPFGTVEGAGPQTSGVRIFRGIPYASPPTGPLRWKPPVPPQKWTGVRKANQFGPRCMQQNDMESRSNGMSEDCLYLNIWTPARSSTEKRPVLLYFYGGGFVAGDGSEPRYDGESMASRGIVVVTLNYRLGVFGFFAHPELSSESPYHGSGNYGLLDQVAALQWVHDNIAAFGGNPQKITIAGESAGSFSVSALMASPLSRELIAGAIGESGSILTGSRAQPLSETEARGVRFASQAPAKSFTELRTLPADQLLQAVGKFAFNDASIDHYLFPKSPAEIYAAGEEAHVPLLAGSNSQEGEYTSVLGPEPDTLEGYHRALQRLYGSNADAVFKVYPAARDGEPVRDAAQALASDQFIAYGTWKWIDEVTKTGGGVHTYYYYYTRIRPPFKSATPQQPARGAYHSVEIEYALGNLDVNPLYAWTPQDYEVSRTMQSYFAHFILSGDPNSPGLPQWPPYASGQRMTLDVVSHAQPDTSAERGAVLDRVEPTRLSKLSVLPRSGPQRRSAIQTHVLQPR